MKLDRNTNKGGRGKYALVLMREIPEPHPATARQVRAIEGAIDTLNHEGCLDYGDAPDNEFFVIRLKDKYAGAALRAYSNAAWLDGQKEWSCEVEQLAIRAEKHPRSKRPD